MASSSSSSGGGSSKRRASNAAAAKQQMSQLTEGVNKTNRGAGGWQSPKSRTATPRAASDDLPEPSSRKLPDLATRCREKILMQESRMAAEGNRDTWLGRYGVWHPEESVVKDEPGGPYELPKVEELESIYKLPIKRARPREDSAGGAIMFQDHSMPPANVEAVVPQKCVLTGDACVQGELPERGAWNEVLIKGKVGAKRILTGQSSGSRKMPTKEGDIDVAKIMVEIGMKDEGPDGIDPELKHLTTGDDGIKFFAEREEWMPAKFLYCNRVDSTKVFRPYDLVVVPRNKVSRTEYFVISTYGMIHIEISPGLLLL